MHSDFSLNTYWYPVAAIWYHVVCWTGEECTCFNNFCTGSRDSKIYGYNYLSMRVLLYTADRDKDSEGTTESNYFCSIIFHGQNCVDTVIRVL